MFLHFVPVDGVEYFSEILGQERYVFIFYVARKQACGQGLSPKRSHLVEHSQKHQNIKTYDI
jgi:hypothetical protein